MLHVQIEVNHPITLYHRKCIGTAQQQKITSLIHNFLYIRMRSQEKVQDFVTAALNTSHECGLHTPLCHGCKKVDAVLHVDHI